MTPVECRGSSVSRGFLEGGIAMAVVPTKTGRSHEARKRLFQSGLRRGFLTVQEIETALPPGALTAPERWLLYFSLRASEVEIRDETGTLVTVPPLSDEELELLLAERQGSSDAEGLEAPHEPGLEERQ
jgi:hypothetical protein